MDWWQALILGIVQGLTEFLPISSSGHLVLLEELMGVEGSDDLLKAFDVALHAGTFLAVVVYFRSDLGRMLAAWARSAVRRKVESTDEKVGWLIFLGTLPAIAAYLFAGDWLSDIEGEMTVVAGMLIGFSLVFLAADLVSERVYARRDELVGFDGLKLRHGIFVGIAQAVALIPGTSRSGATIATGMLLGVNRRDAARFSFLLGTPAVFGAFLVKLPDLALAGGNTGFLVATGVGFAAAFATGTWVIGVLLKFLGERRLSWFVLYRIPVGIFFLWYFTR